MNCENAMELLPWLANGSLSDNERQALDEHLSRCPSCQQELEETRIAAQIYAAHPAADALYDFAAGSGVAAPARELIETHVAACAACAEELAMIRDSQGLLADAEARDERRASTVVRGPWRTRSWAPLALAAALALAVLGPVWVWVASRSGGEPTLAAKTVDLPIEVLRGTESDPKIAQTIHRGDGTVILDLHSDDWALEPGVTVELTDEAGQVIPVPRAQIEQSANAVRARVDAGKLPLGAVTVTVLNADREPLGETRFRVEP